MNRPSRARRRDAGGDFGDAPSHTARSGTTGDRDPATLDSGKRSGHASRPGHARANAREGQAPDRVSECRAPAGHAPAAGAPAGHVPARARDGRAPAGSDPRRSRPRCRRPQRSRPRQHPRQSRPRCQRPQRSRPRRHPRRSRPRRRRPRSAWRRRPVSRSGLCRRAVPPVKSPVRSGIPPRSSTGSCGLHANSADLLVRRGATWRARTSVGRLRPTRSTARRWQVRIGTLTAEPAAQVPAAPSWRLAGRISARLRQPLDEVPPPGQYPPQHTGHGSGRVAGPGQRGRGQHAHGRQGQAANGGTRHDRPWANAADDASDGPAT